MTRDELANHSRNTLGYSERMTQDILDAYDLGARSEREACAKVCETSVFALTLDEWQGMTKKEHGAHAGNVCAAQIRMRSNLNSTTPDV